MKATDRNIHDVLSKAGYKINTKVIHDGDFTRPSFNQKADISRD